MVALGHGHKSFPSTLLGGAASMPLPTPGHASTSRSLWFGGRPGRMWAPVRALKGGKAEEPATPATPADASSPGAFQGAIKALEKLEMVAVPNAEADLGSKIIDTVANAGVPLVFAVLALALGTDVYERYTGKPAHTVRALFFDDPNKLSQDEDNVCTRAVAKLGEPSSVNDVILDKGLDLIYYRRRPSIFSLDEQKRLKDAFKAHVLVWRKEVEQSEALKEDEFQSLLVLDQQLMDLGRLEKRKILAERAENN